jgi:hypothetical protein
VKGLAEIKRDNAPKQSRVSIMVAINEAREQLKAAGVVVDSKALLDAPSASEPCPTCGGTGKRERHLTELERNTLASVDDTWTPTKTVHYNVGGAHVVRATALINRLNDLVALGLVERRKAGKSLEWRRL